MHSLQYRVTYYCERQQRYENTPLPVERNQLWTAEALTTALLLLTEALKTIQTSQRMERSRLVASAH